MTNAACGRTGRGRGPEPRSGLKRPRQLHRHGNASLRGPRTTALLCRWTFAPWDVSTQLVRDPLSSSHEEAARPHCRTGALSCVTALDPESPTSSERPLNSGNAASGPISSGHVSGSCLPPLDREGHRVTITELIEDQIPETCPNFCEVQAYARRTKRTTTASVPALSERAL